MQLLKEFAHRGALLRHTEKNLYLLLSQSATHPLQLLCSLLQILYLRLVYSGPLQQFCSLGPKVCQLVLLKVVPLLGVHRRNKGTDNCFLVSQHVH